MPIIGEKFMKTIKPPAPFGQPDVRPWIFLAGSIESGDAPDWQEEAIQLFDDKGFTGTILNPRRANGDGPDQSLPTSSSSSAAIRSSP
jgi:hypothetical protein